MAVDALDLWLAPNVVGHDAESVAQVAAWVREHIVQAVPQDGVWLTRAVEAFEKQLDIEHQLPAEGAEGDDTAGKLALARTLSGHEDDGGMVRIRSATLEEKLRRRFSPLHVAARVAQVDEVIDRATAARAPVQQALDKLQQRLTDRLWLPPELADGWLAAHRHTLAVIDQLLLRLRHCRAGYAALPVNAQATAGTPVPVALG